MLICFQWLLCNMLFVFISLISLRQIYLNLVIIDDVVAVSDRRVIIAVRHLEINFFQSLNFLFTLEILRSLLLILVHAFVWNYKI